MVGPGTNIKFRKKFRSLLKTVRGLNFMFCSYYKVSGKSDNPVYKWFKHINKSGVCWPLGQRVKNGKLH